MISKVIKLLQMNEFYGAGECTEIAKGKYHLVTDWKGFKRKMKRQWLRKK